jgi:hypothetical protein
MTNLLTRGFLSCIFLITLAAPASSATLVSETFDTDETFTNWYWNAGSYQNPPSFGMAWNQSTTANQFFTTSFSAQTLAPGDSLSVSFNYQANSENINTVRVGFFSGTAATDNGWNQWDNSTAVSSTWKGYSANLRLAAGEVELRETPTDNQHAFFGGSDLGTDTDVTFGSTGNIRAARFSMENVGGSMLLTLEEGANFATLSNVYSITDSNSPITSGFNILSFYMTTDTDSGNGDMRYDNVTVSVIPEPSSLALMVLAIVAGAFFRKRLR